MTKRGTLHRNKPVLRQRASTLRRTMTQPERALWYWLRKSQIDGAKFRRQAVLGDYIVHFICASLKLIIEVDGESHVGTGIADRERDAILTRNGYRVVRITNDDVLFHMTAVLESIQNVISDLRSNRTRRTPTP